MSAVPRPDQSIIRSYQECKFCSSHNGFVFYDSHGYCYTCNEIWFGEDYDQALEDMNEMHWTFRDDKTRVSDPEEYFGFVYLITNKKNQRKYVGCKQYWQMRHRKRYKPSNWKVYTSSSKELCADIEKIGKRNFKFEIIQEYETKRGLHYYEQYYQMKHHVLTAVLEGTDQKEYYNKNVGGVRFYVPLERWEDPEVIERRSAATKARWTDPEYKKKMSSAAKAKRADPNSAYNTPEYKKKQSASMKAKRADPNSIYNTPEYKKKWSATMKAQWNDPNSAFNSPAFRKKVSAAICKGPYRIIFDTGREIIIDNFTDWAKSNGYSQSALSNLLTGRPQFDKRRGKDYKRTKHKDIVKVERIGEHPSDMGE